MSSKAELMKAQIREARLHSHISGMYGALGNTELQQLYGNKSKDLQYKVGEAIDQGFGGLQSSPVEREFKPVPSDEFARILFGGAGEHEPAEQDVEVGDEPELPTHEGALIDVTEVKGVPLDKPIRARHSGDDLFPWRGVGGKLPVSFGVASNEEITGFHLVEESVGGEPTGPDVKLGDLGEGAVIRVFGESCHGDTQTFEEGITYTHDGERDLYWTKDGGQGDELPVYLENEDIVHWELVRR